jgi:hypothetical protein
MVFCKRQRACESVNEVLANPITKPSAAKKTATASRGVLLSPVVERELRVALHRRDARKARSTVARYGVIAVSLFMLFGALTGTAGWGRTLHFYLFLAGLSLAVGPALQISVGLFAEERRQQSLELLYLTGMGAGELFLGKLGGGVLVSSNELLALAPLVALPFLSGGLSFDLFVATAVCLPTVFVLVLAIGLLASALCRQEGTAFVFSGVLVGALCLALPLPYNLGAWLTGQPPFDRAWLAASPALGPWMVTKNFGGFPAVHFWLWVAVMWTLSAAFLAAAATVSKRNWRRDLQGAGPEGWRARWEKFVLGDSRWREALRKRVVAVNAYQWLAQRDRRPVLQAWGFIASVCIFWLLGWCAWPRLWPNPLNFYTTAMLLVLGVDLLTSYAAARRMTDDRRDGALELLLTTPLNPREMLEGQSSALRDQFRPVKWGLCGLLVLMVLGGFLTRAWTTQGVISYLAVWSVFFAWCWRPTRRFAPVAMWVAANCGRPFYWSFRKGGLWNRAWTIYWFSMLANSFGVFGGAARSFPIGSTWEMWVTAVITLWVMLFVIQSRNSSKAMVEPLVSQLRSIAQEPLPERNDPRFKEWKDIRTRFPAPPEGRMSPASEDLVPSKPVKAAGAWFWRPLGRACGLAWGRLLRARAHRHRSSLHAHSR